MMGRVCAVPATQHKFKTAGHIVLVPLIATVAHPQPFRSYVAADETSISVASPTLEVSQTVNTDAYRFITRLRLPLFHKRLSNFSILITIAVLFIILR